MEQLDLAERIHNDIKRAKSFLADWRKEAIDSYNYYSGDQWTDEDKSILAEQGRPAIVFNRIARTINTVIGMEVSNRQDVRFIPRETSDGMVNDILTQAAKWARDNTDAEDEESEAFLDLLICGEGWTEDRVDYDSNPDGDIVKERVDPMEMLWDPDAKKRNHDDAGWVARVKDIPIEEFKKNWPEHADLAITGDFWPDGEAGVHNASEAWKYENNSTQQVNKKTVPVIHYQWWDKEPFYRVATPNKVVELSVSKFKKVKEYLDQSGLQYVKQQKRKFYQAFFVYGNESGTVLEQSDGACDHSFTLKAMTGMRDRNRNYWLGLVSLMKDPQMWANKWLSQILHIVNSNAKGGLLAETGAFENPRKAEEDWAGSDTIIWLNPGGLGKVQEKGAGTYPAALDKLLDQALNAINDVPGVSLELMGMANRNQAGYLEAMRKSSSTIILATFFDALRRYRKESGRVLAYFIKNYISDGRLVRIVGPQGQQYIPLLRDHMTYEYDVVVDDSPTSPNMADKVFSTMMELLPSVQAGVLPKVPPDFIDYLPIPQEFKEKWKMSTRQQPDPMQQKMQQIMMEREQLTNEKMGSEIVKNHASAEKDSAIARDEAAQALQKLGLTEMEAKVKVNGMMVEQQMKAQAMMADNQIKQQAVIQDQDRKDIAFIREQQRKDEAAKAAQLRK